MSNPRYRAALPQACGPLLPIGGGYSATYAGFAEAVFSQASKSGARNSAPLIVVLPTAYSSNPHWITPAERSRNLKDAEVRRAQIEQACRQAAPEGIACRVALAPIFTQADARDALKVAPLRRKPAAVFMLGGDQTVAMRVLAGTPAEAALLAAHRGGAIIAGTSAGGGMLAAEMLCGYNPDYSASNALHPRATDIWNSAQRRGLPFGVRGAVLDQHFFQRGRLGRLLSAISLPGAPTLGIGIDAHTGAAITGERLDRVFGLYGVAVVDAGTYHARHLRAGARCEDQRVTSLRNVLVHLLAPGGVHYDLRARRCSLAAPRQNVTRSYTGLTPPKGAGTLLLSGGLASGPGRDALVARFGELARGRILVFAGGCDQANEARALGEEFARAYGLEAEVVTAEDAGRIPLALRRASGIALIGRDQSCLDLNALNGWLHGAWLSGLPLLACDALAAVLGRFYSAHGPTPARGLPAEMATERSFCAGETCIQEGLGFLETMIEPQLMADNRWGRLFSLAYAHPQLLALGLNRDAGIEIDHTGARAVGSNATLALDLATATLDTGDNQGFVIANGLLDVFAPGDDVCPVPAMMARRSTKRLYDSCAFSNRPAARLQLRER